MASARERLGVLVATCGLVALVSLSLVVATASAEERAFESQITGFTQPAEVAIDSTGNVWVSDMSTGLVSEFEALPSFAKIAERDGGGHWSHQFLESLAVNSVDGSLDVSDSLPVAVDIFTSGGAFVKQFSHEFGGGYLHLADDPSNGDILVSSTNGLVQKFDNAGNPVSFSGSAGYISGNEITGTPGGSFGTPWYIAVDEEGKIYVVDSGDNVIDEFAPNGKFLMEFTGAGAPGGFTGQLAGVAVDPTNGNVVVVDRGTDYVDEFEPDGTFAEQLKGTGPGEGFGNLLGGIGVDQTGHLYIPSYGSGTVDVFGPSTLLPKINNEALSGQTHTSGTVHATVDPNGAGDLVECEVEYGTTVSYSLGSIPCTPDPAANPPTSHFSAPTAVKADLSGLTSETTYHYRVVVSNGLPHGIAKGRDQTYTPKAVLAATTEAATEVEATKITLHGSYLGEGIPTQYYFQYGGTEAYGHTTPVQEDGSQTGTRQVSAFASGLQSHFKYHFRLVATNQYGTSYGEDEVAAETPSVPSVAGTSASELTATTAVLNAEINPQGFPTNYRFEYGESPNYGQVIPVPDGEVTPANATTDQHVEVQLSGLQPHGVYHFRVVATNKWGTVTTEDQTFNFFPPSCPNENLRQQTQANYLPDCRAYELVSPEDAGGTQLYPGGPNTGRAISPSRLSFVGLWGEIPGSGGQAVNGTGDLYVATRTSQGWKTRYVGLPSSEVAVDGGPPEGLPDSAIEPVSFYPANQSFGGSPVDKIQNNVLTDPEMSTFLDWSDGNQAVGNSLQAGDIGNLSPIASNAPYVWSATGEALGRWPTNLDTVPAGVHTHIDTHGEPTNIQPGGSHSLDCYLQIGIGGFDIYNYNRCPGDVTASGDLSHFVFASEWNVFAEGGTMTPPGSVYDNDTKAGTVVVASVKTNHEPIPSEPGDLTGSPLQVPAVSRDGSHILIAASSTGPCGKAECPDPPCGGEPTRRCPMQASHLYMRVDEAVTYDVSKGHAVNYVGIAEGGEKVYFTSEEQLTEEDQDTSTDLYMWSEATDSVKLVSIGSDGTGNTDACATAFTVQCGVVTFSPAQQLCTTPGNIDGNCKSDNSIAPENGDIYFFSPEQLDGSLGVPDAENIYDYREGRPRYVATADAGKFCHLDRFELCSDGPVTRMQVSPTDSHMAFVTAADVTQYDSAGYQEMYTYNPATGNVLCVSCLPSGQPPTSNVLASQNGLFMSDDGRTAFSTEDALVHGDTNNGEDVYEFADGRPQLISPGTGETTGPSEALEDVPGFVGISGDGTDLYFSTYSTLVPQDQNGLFLKFYDARSGGGFSAAPASLPCEAADECHGAGSLSPAAQQNETAAQLAGGNVESRPSKKHHHKKKRKSGEGHHKRHRGHRGQGGSR